MRKRSFVVNSFRQRLVASGLVGALLLIVGTGLYIQQLKSHALTEHTYTTQFDYGQISGPGFSQPAGAEFEATMYGQFNFNNTSPQHSIFRVGYLTSRVQALSVTCLQEWGCHKSNAMPGFRNRPHIAVCMDVPNGRFPERTPLFKIRFKAVTPLNENNTWWTSDSAVAPGTCLSNPNSDGLRVNTVDGSGVCGGAFEACDNGPNPGGETYIGFGPRGTTTGPDGSGPEGSGPGPGPSGRSGGSAGSTAKTQANQPNPIPDASAQGEEKQPEIEPSPFFDGKQYEPGSDSTSSINSVASASRQILGNWPYILVAFAMIGAGVGYWLWRQRLSSKKVKSAKR
jgi:hypothetical protein